MKLGAWVRRRKHEVSANNSSPETTKTNTTTVGTFGIGTDSKNPRAKQPRFEGNAAHHSRWLRANGVSP